MTRLLLALQGMRPAAATFGGTPTTRLRIDAPLHRSQRWLTPLQPVATQDSGVASEHSATGGSRAWFVATTAAPALTEAPPASQDAEPAQPAMPELQRLTAAPYPSEQDDEQGTSCEPAQRHVSADEPATGVLRRLATWRAADERQVRRRPRPSPDTRLPIAFQRWLEAQLRVHQIRQQFGQIGSRVAHHLSAHDRAVTFCGLSGEADLSLSLLAVAQALGQRGYRVLLVELDQRLQSLAWLLGQVETVPSAPAAEGFSASMRLPLANVWFSRATRPLGVNPRPVQDVLAVAGMATYDVYLTSLGLADPHSAGLMAPFHPGRLVAVTRIGVTKRMDYHGFVRHVKNQGWHLEGCVVLGDRV